MSEFSTTRTSSKSKAQSPQTPHLHVPKEPESPRPRTPDVGPEINGQKSNRGVAQISMNHEDALERELAYRRLLEVPGLLEHIFSEESLIQQIGHVAQNLWNSASALWDTERSRWTHFPDPEGDVEVPSNEDGSADEMAFFLNVLGDEIHKLFPCPTETAPPRRRWATTWAVVEKASMNQASPAQEKPQLFLMEDNTPSSLSDFPTWHNILATASIRSIESNHPETLTQLTYNAWMTFCSQDDRRFFLGVSFAGSKVRLCAVDRSGVVGSQAIDIHTQPDRFIHLLTGLVLGQRKDIGFDPNICADVISGRRFVDVATVRYEILETIFISDALVGSGTVCWRARRVIEEGGEGDVVIKTVWVDEESGMNEREIMGLVGDVEGVVKLVASEAVLVNGEEDTTDHVRLVIQESYADFQNMNDIEIRALHRLVLTPYAQEITQFSSKRELLSVFIDAVQAHKRLLNKGILHYDINLENIMIHDCRLPSATTYEQDGSRRRGLLIDFGCAIQVPENSSLAENRVDASTVLPCKNGGEILEVFERKVDEDLQAFLFILIWICWYRSGPRGSLRQDFTALNEDLLAGNKFLDTEAGSMNSHWEDIGIYKFASVCMTEDTENLFENVILANFSPYFKDLKACVTALRQLIFGRRETRVTHDEIVAVLQEAQAQLPSEHRQLAKVPTQRHQLSPNHGARKRKKRRLEENDRNLR
ncbi:hypothetical protein BDN70DRAFT_923155 [Pholiota conissans]|uniref:Protein kinase domain-containing protein n=1 Tax=Pholiota conissans TaxID=109636 RepID=A0A9P6CXI5_9AGAR|nr:hypothetical protein BDN70DRAFT_923155 [Pholiota conissans]